MPMKECSIQEFRAECPCRGLFDQVADKWSMMILAVLADGPLRFNAIKRGLEGITQKALTQTLRKLERNGIIARHVIATSPVAVEYEITPLGRTLIEPLKALYYWTKEKLPEVDAARAEFDARMEESA